MTNERKFCLDYSNDIALPGPGADSANHIDKWAMVQEGLQAVERNDADCRRAPV
jgi:hypothetical protein